jgi:hypothetical protein
MKICRAREQPRPRLGLTQLVRRSFSFLSKAADVAEQNKRHAIDTAQRLSEQGTEESQYGIQHLRHVIAIWELREAISERPNLHCLSYQICDVARAHALHHPGAMIFDGLRANVEPDPDLLA